MFHIEPLKLWVHKVLPVVYDDSLSYYEVLAKVTKKLNEVIDLTDEQTQYIETFTGNLTEAIQNWETGIESEWSNYKRDLNGEWQSFISSTEQYLKNWTSMQEGDIEDAIAAGIIQFETYFADLTQTAVDAAAAAEAAAETAAEDAVEAVLPTLEDTFDERYAWRTAVGSPLVASTAAGMTDTDKIYVYVGSETGYVSGDWYYYDGTAWQDGGVYNSAAIVTDPTLSEAGMPADAKAAGDEIADLKSAISNRDAKSLIINQAILQCFEHVAWENTNGNTYYQELEAAINETGILEYISVVYTQGSTLIYADTPIESLRDNLVVTAHFSSGNTRIVTDYGLYGDLIPDTSSTVTVAYINKITTFSVTVTKPIYSLTSDSRTFQYGDKITVSKGNHIRLERSSHQFTGGCFINFSDMSLNGNDIQWQANATAINNLTTSLFTLSSGDEYTLSIKNLRPDIADMFFGSGASRVFTNDFRKVNSDVIAFDEVSIRNGIVKLTSSGTVTDEMGVSCAFMYFGDGTTSGLSRNITVEYDLELIINGIRVI